MHKRWAFLFPGQGVQYSGMARDFYDAFPVAKETFQEADDLLKETFSKRIFEGSAAELTLTKNSQIAIFIASVAILRAVRHQFPTLEPAVCAGLSLGEYTALTASGKISFAECLDLVRVRAIAMHEACELKRGGMQVVLGLSEEAVAQVIAPIAEHPIWIANLNCPEQVVIAAAEEDMPFAVRALKEKGAKRIIPLEVSGAFHSGLMRPAQEKLAVKILQVQFKPSPIEIVMNVPGDYVSDPDAIRRYLFEQVISSVRWERGIRAMMGKSIDIYLEMGPGKTLSGMNKRIGVAAPTLSIEKVTDLAQLSNYTNSVYQEAHAITQC